MIDKLRHRLLLEAPIYAQGVEGETLREWREEARMWGSVRALSGDELVLGEGETAHIRYEVIVRYHENISAQMRFIYDERRLNIQAVLDKQGRKRYLTCLCEEAAK